jgi:hypothetical protein
MSPANIAPPDELNLPEMLRIMDVATALRQDRELVEQHLNLDELKAKLRERLLAGSGVTGEPVTPEEVDRAIEQYFESRNTFRDPPRGIETTLAHLYVRRMPLARWGGAILVGVLALWLLFLSPSAPLSSQGRAQRALASLTSEIGRQEQTVRALAQDPAAVSAAERLEREARTFAEQGDKARLQSVRDELARLSERLEQEYTVRIISRPGEKSGIDRYFTDAEGKRASGYYLIVEAVGPDQKTVKRLVHNIEDNRDEDVTRWGERVPKAVYDRIARDKKADGIVDENIFAIKRRGRLDDEVVMKGSDGQPLKRLGQITRW